MHSKTHSSFLFATVALLWVINSKGQSLAKERWLLSEGSDAAYMISQRPVIGPIWMEPYIYQFDWRHSAEGNKELAYHGYQFDPNGGGTVIGKPLPLVMEGSKGWMIGAVPMTTRIMVLYYNFVERGAMVNLMAQAYNPEDLEPLSESIKIGEVAFAEKVGLRFEPLICVSPDRKSILVYYDAVKQKDGTSLIMCWVLGEDSKLKWSGIHPRPGYFGNEGPDWDRNVCIANDGSVFVAMRSVKSEVTLLNYLRDPEEQTEPKLYRIKGEDVAIINLEHNSLTLRHPRLLASDSGVFVYSLASKTKHGEAAADRALHRVSNLMELQVVFSHKGGSAKGNFEVLPRRKGGWYSVYSAAKGQPIEIALIQGGTRPTWVTKAARWQAMWDQVVEHNDNLFVLAAVPKPSLKGIPRGGPVYLKEGATRCAPVYLRCRGKNKVEIGVLFDPAVDGLRDVLFMGKPHFPSVAESGMFMENSRLLKKRGVKVVVIQ